MPDASAGQYLIFVSLAAVWVSGYTVADVSEAIGVRSEGILSWREAVRPGVVAIRRLWRPFVLLQLCGLAVVIAYFKIDAFRAACAHLAAWKHAGGYAFSALAMAFSAAILPEVFLFLTGDNRRFDRRRLRDVGFHLIVFAIGGVCVDAFYRLMAFTFGDSPSPLAVAAKVLSDQFVYSPLLGVGIIATAYSLRRQRFRAMRWRRKLGWRWYVKEVVPLLPPCWAYWIPMCTLMYTLPADLTFVFGVVASAASATLLTAVARDR